MRTDFAERVMDQRAEPQPRASWRLGRLLLALRDDYLLVLSTDVRGQSFWAHVWNPVWRSPKSTLAKIVLTPAEGQWAAACAREASRMAEDAADSLPVASGH